MIIVEFNDNIAHSYNSFEEILKLDDYNHIIYMDCYNTNLSSLPELPNSLINLYCSNNDLSSLPELPNSLTKLHCNNNNLSSLPELPNSLKQLWCHHNNLSSLPKLPNSLIKMYCSNNNLSSLPEFPNLLEIYMINNPICDYIIYYFNSYVDDYFEHQTNMKRKFINKIENWFLDCKYNPKYLYCRKRLMKEYDELYT